MVAPEPIDLREVPAVAVCAICGDASCVGHDHEISGERPIHRMFAWEDGETPLFAALWSTSIASTRDLDLWIRASRSDRPVMTALTFAIACESAATCAVAIPGGTFLGALLWLDTHNQALALGAIECGLRVGVAFVPLMIAIHVVYQLVIARAAAKLGTPSPLATSLRAGLFSCGWDLATGPAGVLAAALTGNFREAMVRLRGNSTLYSDATERWLEAVHGVHPRHAARVSRATWLPMAVLVAAALAIVAWSVVTSWGG